MLLQSMLLFVLGVLAFCIMLWHRFRLSNTPICSVFILGLNWIIVFVLRYCSVVIGLLLSFFWFIHEKTIDWTMGKAYSPLTSCVFRNGRRVIVTSDPEFVKHALPMGRRGSGGDGVRPMMRKLQIIEEKTTDPYSLGEWRAAFRTVQTTFCKDNIKSFVRKSALFHINYINELEARVLGGESDFPLYDYLWGVSFDSMMHAVYGLDLRTLDDDTHRLFDHIRDLQAPFALFSKKTLKHYLQDCCERDPIHSHWRLFDIPRPAAAKAFGRIGSAVIERMRSGKGPSNGTCPFLKNYINGPGYDRENDQLGTNVALLTVLAGTEKMANALRYIIYLLSRNPEKQAIMREEVYRVLNSKNHFTFEDLKEFVYVEAVILESLRLFPPRGALTRYVEKPAKVCGISLQKGDQIDIDVWQMNLSHENFPKPWAFLPERFSDEHVRKQQKHENLLTFGADPCPGKDFAMNLMKHFLVTFTVSLEVKQTEGAPVQFHLPRDKLDTDHCY